VTPAVSVIIPTYNGARRLPWCCAHHRPALGSRPGAIFRARASFAQINS
jgi:hypothetical protein